MDPSSGSDRFHSLSAPPSSSRPIPRRRSVKTMSEPSRFRPARSPGWVIWAAQVLNRLDLAWGNRLRIESRDLEVLRGLPAGAGAILVSNHADETDMRACLELSRRCGRRFLYM